jgi:hypothetical protein
MKLRYTVRDDSGRTRERVRVYRGRRILATFTRRLRATEASVPYWVLWRAPGRRERLRFCVLATDPSGNHTTSCALIRIR